MDRRVKERLVGASILVLLLVLIVPELLSGPKPATRIVQRLPASTPEPVRNITVDLATSKPPAPEPLPTPAEAASTVAGSTPPASAPRGSPSASAAVPVKPPPTVTTLPAAGPPAGGAAGSAAGSTAPLETPPSSPTSRLTRAWGVQLGSFASRANADKLVHQLKAQGFLVYVAPLGAGAAARYRVRIGPLNDRAAAAQVVAQLKSLGHTASIVTPAS